MRSLVWGILALVVCVVGHAEPDCKDALTPIPAFRHVLPEQHSNITKLIADYDPAQDILIPFFGGHPSIYIAGKTWDWSGGYSFKNGGKLAPHGLCVRIRVGAAKIQQILQSIAAETYNGIKTATCQHNTFLFLHQNGVMMVGGIPLLSTTSLERIRFQGFMDESGKRYQQTLHFLWADGHTDVLPHVYGSWRDLGLQQIIWVFRDLGFTDQDLMTVLQMLVPGDGAERAYQALLDPANKHQLFSHVEREALQAKLRVFEQRLLSSMKQTHGIGSSDGFYYFATHRNEFPSEKIRAELLPLFQGL